MNTVFAIFKTIHSLTILKDKYSSFEPPTLILMGRSLSNSWKIKFDIFGPSAFTLADRSLSYFQIVRFYTFGPSTFILLDRSIFSPGPSIFIQMTIHCGPRPFTFAGPFTLGTVHFGSSIATGVTVARGTHDLWKLWLTSGAKQW